VSDLRANRNVAENAKQIETLSSRIDASLTKVQGYGQNFEAGVVRARTSITILGDRIRWRLSVISVVCTLLLLWMACGQLSLTMHGRKILRQQ
jgi:hypothetical protein